MIIFLAGCGVETSKKEASADGSAPKSEKLIKVRYAQLSKAVLNIYIPFAAEHGIFKKHGIDLEAINFDNGGPEALAAVASGQAEMGSFGTPSLTGISKNIPYKIVAAPVDRQTTFVLVATPKIKTIQDLKGKVIATGGVGSGPHQALLKILEANNIKKDEVKIQAAGDIN
jgi:NitT/TauT family transport system substrate-binding protein